MAMRISAPGLFVGGTWLVMVAAAVLYVVRFAAPDPFGDEWDLVGGLTYQEPYLKWLWAQHNEHRLPLPKLVYTWLLNLSHFDARAGGLATVSILAGLSMAFVLAARRLRGQTEYADAFFPIAFLNWGHFENYLIGFQVSFAMSIALVSIWLLSALSWSERKQPASIKWMGIALIGLPLCGAHGLVYTPPLGLATLWMARAATRYVKVYAAMTTAAAWAMAAAYFRDYLAPVGHPQSAGVFASARIALEVASLGWGWVGQMTWPVSGMLIGLFASMTAIGLLLAIVNQPQQRDRDVAIAAVGIGAVALTLGIGWGRSGFGPLAGFAVRYGMLMLPLMAAGYLFWTTCGERVLRSLVPMTMFTIVCLFLTQHCRTGLAEGVASAAAMSAFAEDLQAGMSAEELAQCHAKLYPNADRFAERIRTLQWAEIPRYQIRSAQAQR